MKWIGILFFLVLMNAHAKSQAYIAAQDKNNINHLAITDFKSPVHFFTNVNESSPPAVNAKFMSSESKSVFFSKMYVKVYGGYGLFTPGSFKVNSTYFLGDTAVKTQTKKGLGNGFRFGVGLGIVMNDFLNIGFDVEYHKRSWSENVLDKQIDATNFNTENSKIDYKTISLTPYVIFKALAKPNYFVYNKLGLLLTMPFTLGTTHESSYANNLMLENGLKTFVQNSNSTTTNKYKISLGIGVNIALGVNVKINGKLRMFGEIFGNYSALTPQSSIQFDHTKKFVSLSSQDSDPVIIKQISDITTNTTYKRGGSLPASGTYRSGQPELVDDYTKTDVTIKAVAHQFTINMAVLGVNTGIIYRF